MIVHLLNDNRVTPGSQNHGSHRAVSLLNGFALRLPFMFDIF
jgi:hypothetical protein